jgi:hypothetical protein
VADALQENRKFSSVFLNSSVPRNITHISSSVPKLTKLFEIDEYTNILSLTDERTCRPVHPFFPCAPIASLSTSQKIQNEAAIATLRAATALGAAATSTHVQPPAGPPCSSASAHRGVAPRLAAIEDAPRRVEPLNTASSLLRPLKRHPSKRRCPAARIGAGLSCLRSLPVLERPTTAASG